VGTLKTLKYLASTENEERLNQRLSDACQTIRNRPRPLEKVQKFKLGRVHACIWCKWRTFWAFLVN